MCDKSLFGEMKTWADTESNGEKADAYFTEEEYLKIKEELEVNQQIIEIQTSEEFEIQKMLIRDITQKKKSLNLLKGDMGHMIDRNESISVLESKVSKVSLISQNQLSKISLALTKDREEVQLREKMQKKFHCKLKGVESQARKNLKKINSSYIEAMRRRKYVHERLTDIEKECASIEEYSDKLRQKEEKNQKSASIFMFLCNVSEAIDKSDNLCLMEKNKSITRKEHYEELQNVLMSLSNVNECDNVEERIEGITKENLNILTEKIIREFRSLEEQIQYKRKEYVEEMGSISNFCLKFNKFNQERSNLNADHLLENRNELLDQKISLDEYFKKLNALESSFKVFYTLIDFMSKKIKKFNGIKLINELYRNQMFHYKIDSEVTNQKIEAPSKEIFSKLKENFEFWFKDLRKVAKSCKNRRDSQQNRALNMFLMKSKSSPTGGFHFNKHAEPKYLSQTEKTDNDENAVNMKTEEESEYDDDLEVEQFSELKCDTIEVRNNSSIEEGNEEQVEAKRVQVLAEIDQNYHNMIKETLQMEKDSTMKNYKFKQSFKRNKYSSQDEILEEKRFEATFSGFFKQDSDLSKFKTLANTPKLKCNKVANLEKIRVPFSTVHHPRTEINIIRLSGSESFQKNVSTLEKEKKKKLSQKLKDLFSRAEV